MPAVLSGARQPARYRWPRLPLAVLLLFVLAELAALPGESPTVDEQAHLARGLTYARTGDLRLYIGHPPLINVLAALPLLPDTRITLPLQSAAWQRADWIEFPILLFWKLDNPALAMFAAGRIMIILLGALLLAVLYRLGADLGGPALGLAAMSLAALDPNLRAHARLVTTDLGLTLFLWATVWLWRRWRRRARWPRGLVVGVLWGLALASKYPALIWSAGLLTATLLAGGGWRHWRALLVVGAAAGLSLWAVYGFELRAPAGWPVPLPFATYWQEFRWSLNDVAHTPAFMLGQTSRDGFYAYFLVALAVKLPLPLLALALGGLGLGLRALWRRGWRTELGLWLPALTFLAAAVAARINIGYRHIMPIWPLLYLGAGWALLQLWRRPRLGRAAGLALAGWLAASSLWIYPRDLTFFNELAGGPDHGYQVLVDSNLDWGQDLGLLTAFVRERGIQQIRVSYFGAVPIGSFPVRAFPIPAQPLPPRPTPDWHALFPAPGWYAISVTHLMGGAVLRNPDTFAFFRHRQPDYILGRTIYVYHLTAESGSVAICVNPPPGMGTADARRLFGAAAQRILTFDCAKGLPLPAGRTWYLLRGEQAEKLRPALERLGAALLFDEPHHPDPAYAFSLYGLADAAGQAAAYPRQPQGPATFGGLATFLGWGYTAPPRAGQPGQVETTWRLEAPLPGPLSIFLHLNAPDGFPVAVSDGFNTPVDQLQPGDALIQFHPLADSPADLPAGAGFTTGLYALSGDQARYRLPDGADALALEPRH